MSYRHRDEEGLPNGYHVRGGRLALNVKVYRGPTEEECAAVGEECGIQPGEVSGPLTNERGGARGVFGGPWGREWLELLAAHRPEEYAVLEGFARDDRWEWAKDEAVELLGRDVKLYSDGRMGGWLVIHGRAGDADAAREAVELVESHALGGAEDAGELAEARELLAGLERFRELVAAAVADFPRAVAWQVCVNGFQPAAEAYRRTCALESARGVLAEARAELAFRALGCRNELAELAAGALAETEARDAREIVTAFDRALDAERAARAEVDRLENEGGAE